MKEAATCRESPGTERWLSKQTGLFEVRDRGPRGGALVCWRCVAISCDSNPVESILVRE